MTSLNSAVKKTEELLNKSRKFNFEYRDYRDQLDRQVETEDKGRREAQNLLKAHEEKILNELDYDKTQVFKDLEAAKVEENKKIEEEEQPVTADMLAELQMLDSTFVKGEKLDRYVEKYKNTPLALRMLKDIADKHGTMVDIPTSKGDQLKAFLANIQSYAESASKPQFNREKPVIDMITEGRLDSLKSDSEIYSKL